MLTIWFYNNVVWRIKQLLPFTYRTHYSDDGGKRHFAVWNMWFGRCFNVEDIIIGE